MCSSPYVSGYNELISDISHDLKGSFPAIASPTLSKQETVSFLHQLIQGGSKKKNNYPSFPWRRMLEFVPRIILMFFKVIYASVCFRVKEFPENAVVFKTWLVPRSVSGGKLVDDYFRQLTDDLESYENVVTCFSSTDIKLLRSFANIEKKDNQILSYGLLSLLDVFKLFGFYLTTALVQSKRKYYLEGENVTRYINYSLLLDYLELRSFEAYAELYKCNNLIKYNILV